MTDNTYNGWTNYETWNWNLWISNDQGEYELWLSEARAWLQDDGIRQHAIWNLAEQMETSADEMVEHFTEGKAGPLVDLLNASLSQINWREIAESLVDAVAEQDTHKEYVA